MAKPNGVRSDDQSVVIQIESSSSEEPSKGEAVPPEVKPMTHLPFQDTLTILEERGAADGRYYQAGAVSPARIGTLASFVTVIFEYFFIFLVGFFIGSGCTLVLATYIIGLNYRTCTADKSSTMVNTGDGQVSQTSNCLWLFTVFCISAGGIAALYCLFMAIRAVFSRDRRPQHNIDQLESSSRL